MIKPFPKTPQELDVALTDIKANGAKQEDVTAFIAEYKRRKATAPSAAPTTPESTETPGVSFGNMNAQPPAETPDQARVSTPDGGFSFGNMGAKPPVSLVKKDSLGNDVSPPLSEPERLRQKANFEESLGNVSQSIKDTRILGIPVGAVLDTGKAIVRDVGRGAQGMSNLLDSTAGALGRETAKLFKDDAGDQRVNAQQEQISQGVQDIQNTVEDSTKATTVPQWLADFGAKALETMAIAPAAGTAGLAAKGAQTGIKGALLKAAGQGAVYGAEGALTAKEGDRALTGALSGGIGATTSLAGDAFQGLRKAVYEIQNIDDKIKATINPSIFTSKSGQAVQEGIKNPEQAKLISQVIDDVKLHNTTPRSDSALSKLAKVIDGAYTKLQNLSTNTTVAQQNALKEVAGNKIPPEAWNNVREGVVNFLDSKNIIQKVKNGKTVFAVAPGRKALVPLNEVKQILKIVNSAQKKGNVGYVADTVKELQQLVKPNGGIHPFSDAGEALQSHVSSLLRKAREAGSVGTAYSSTIAKNSKLQNAIKFVEKIGGNEGQRGELIAKRLFAENNADANEFAKVLKEFTGVDIYPQAQYVKWATELFGNQASRSLLSQAIDSGSKAGLAKNTAQWVLQKLSDPKSEVLRIAAGKPFGGALAEIVKNAPPAVVAGAQSIIDYLESEE